MPTRRTLTTQLHGTGFVGQAFHKIVKAARDREVFEHDLERWLTKLESESYIYPLGRTTSLFPAERRRKLERVAADLENAAAELGRGGGFWILSWGSSRDVLGCNTALEMRQTLDALRKLAQIVRNANSTLGDSTSGTVKRMGASWPITAIVSEVRRRTGKPHYSQLATLIGAAYRKPNFAESDLKMLVTRHESNARPQKKTRHSD